jgi:hypothetical protein
MFPVVVVIRYADDTVLSFEHRFEAVRLLDDLRAQAQEFGLELHPEKTRLIAFGRFANRWNQKHGRRKAETFTNPCISKRTFIAFHCLKIMWMREPEDARRRWTQAVA